jgi:hypothetical protein
LSDLLLLLFLLFWLLALPLGLWCLVLVTIGLARVYIFAILLFLGGTLSL